MELTKLWKHDHPTCAAGCGTTWMKYVGEIDTTFGVMYLYKCSRGHCSMVTAVAREVR